MKYEKYTEIPVSIWTADPYSNGRRAVPDFMDEPVLELMKKHNAVAFRGVKVDRLPTILDAGIDVHPTDSIIYCDDIEKAFEYGNVIMALRYRDENENLVLRRALTTILPETSPEDAVERRRLYPHVLGTTDRGVTHLSRFDADNAARLGYIRDFGHFVPGDPWQALVGIFIYGDTDVLRVAQQVIDRSRESSRD